MEKDNSKFLELCDVAIEELERIRREQTRREQTRRENEYAKSLPNHCFSTYIENTSDELRKKFSFKCKFSPQVCSEVKESYGNEDKALLEIKVHLINAHSVLDFFPAILKRPRRNLCYAKQLCPSKRMKNRSFLKSRIKTNNKEGNVLDKDFEVNDLDCVLNTIKYGDFEHTYAKSPHQLCDVIPSIFQAKRKNRRHNRDLPSSNLVQKIRSYSFPVPLTIETPDLPLIHESSDMSFSIELDIDGNPVNYQCPIFDIPSTSTVPTKAMKNKMIRKKSKFVPKVDAPRSVLECVENRVACKSNASSEQKVLQDNIENVDENMDEIPYQTLTEQRKKRGRAKPANYVCEICDQHFTTNASLNYHYNSHLQFKPFTCDVCKNHFTRRHSLKYHMMIHDNKIRFKCDSCEKGFRHPYHYKDHLRKHKAGKLFKTQHKKK